MTTQSFDYIKEDKTYPMTFRYEKYLQTVVKENMVDYFGVTFIKEEFVLKDSEKEQSNPRIDAIGLDENNSPVIFEYKRNYDQNIIIQGLYYLHLLEQVENRESFKNFVGEKCGEEKSEKIDWTYPYIYCIAEGFNRYDKYAIHQIGKNIKLVEYCVKNDQIHFRHLNEISNENQETEFDKHYQSIKDSHELDEVYQALNSYIKKKSNISVHKTRNHISYKKNRFFAGMAAYKKKYSYDEELFKHIKIYLSIDEKDAEILLSGLSWKKTEYEDNFGYGDICVLVQYAKDIPTLKEAIDLAYDKS